MLKCLQAARALEMLCHVTAHVEKILKTQNVDTFIKNYTITISLKLVKFAHCNCTIHIHHRINKNTWTLHIIGKSTYIIGYEF